MAETLWPDYQVRAKNIASQSENRIHSDDVARAYGFKGALVSGVAVYSYMTRPLVEHFGEAWLARGSAEVTFFKPAYDADLLSIQARPAPEGDAVVVTALNEEGTGLARLDARLDAGPPGGGAPVSAGAAPEFTGKPPQAVREQIDWGTLELHRPLWTLRWRPDAADNTKWADDVMDDLPLYRQGEDAPLHPGYVLRAANRVLSNQFVLPAWIHVSSKVQTHMTLRAGQEIDVHAVPVEKFEKKGHQFTVIDMQMTAAGGTAVEVRHTAIFNVRKAA